MKRLFTLVVLMAMVLGANAKWSDEPVYKINYSTYQSFPFYVMAYAPSFDGTAMIDAPTTQKLWRGTENDYPGDEAMSGEVTVNGTAFKVQELGENQWRQYFIADGIPTLLDGRYKVVAHVKASAAVNINVNMGWGWGNGQQAGTSVAIPDGSAGFQEVTWEYSGINGTSCNLVAQPGGSTETIEWLSLEVYEWQKEGQRPKIWLQDIVNGNAETEWTEEQKAIKYNDSEQNFTICAWSKEKGRNVDETADGQPWNPFPADIEVDPKDPNNHVFVCHGQVADSPKQGDADVSSWDNQFWIQSQHSWPSGTTLKIKFRYMCDYANEVKTNTQVHKQNPSDYLIWHAIGDITFKNDWQTFDGTMSIADDMADGWSIAFNLNPNVKDAVNFYFDDLSWEYLQLDEGYFLSGINATTTTSYDDLDNAIMFEDGISFEGDACLIATFGTSGDANTYVDQVMISTKRGDDQAFKGATLKPESNPKTTTPDDWITYAPSTNAKIDLPGLGVWKVYLDLEYTTMAFEMLEGTPYEQPDPVDVFTYTDEVVVNGKTREYTEAEAEAAGIEKPENPGQAWDNQFFIVANHTLKAGDKTHIAFKYKRSEYQGTAENVTSGTQSHNAPGQYIHWAAIGSFTFTDEWQDFDADFEIPKECDGSQADGFMKDFKSIAFNMAEVKDACNYHFKDVQWYVVDTSLEAGQTYDNLISGETNFYKKEGAGTEPYTGIENVIINTGKTSSAIYNLAGQKVNKNYKGILIKDGKKFVNK